MPALHPDFSSTDWNDGVGYGIPFNKVTASTPTSSVDFRWDDESDAGPYPIPANPKIENASDRHILLWDTEGCDLYELFNARKSGGAWLADSGAIWNLRSNALRPNGWTSADAAGLPILPGLARYDEVAAGRDPARAPVHGAADVRRPHPPGPPRRRELQLLDPPADGPPDPAQGVRGHLRVSGPRRG